MVRSPCFDKNGLKKGAWSMEEDEKLRAYVERYGHWNWRELPKFAGLRRCGKSCRLRWLNYLKPDVKRGNYSENEEDLIIKLHEQLGNKWSTIASQLPGRTDNEIKNYWHSHLKKRVEANSSSSKTEEQLKSTNTSSNQQSSGPCSIESSDHGLWTSSMDSGTEDSAGSSEVININNQHLIATGDFWSQPFLTDNIFSMLNMDISSPNLETAGLPSPYASSSYYDDVGIDLFNQLWTPDLPGSY